MRVFVCVLGLGICAPAAARADIWKKEREGGIVVFTNIPPVGKDWQVLYRTGPGKAKAIRNHGFAGDIRPPRDTSPERYSRFDSHIRDQNQYYGIPVALMRAIIKTESDFDPDVVSSAGAKGLMQLMPETARSMGVTRIFDPRQNIFGGARFLATLVARFCRSSSACESKEIIKVIAAYHAGPGAVEKYGGTPPYETTKAYVTNVLKRFQQYEQQTDKRVLAER